MKTVYVCSDTVTGVFSAIYDAWKEKKREEECRIEFIGELEQELFCEYAEVEERDSKRRAVEKLIRDHMGMQAYHDLYLAVLSDEKDKADAVYGTMQAARTLKDSKRIMDHLSCPRVERVFELSRMVGNEAHYHIEFSRFRELDNGVLYAPVTPKARVLVCIAPHFEDRFPLENWMIHDKIHKEFAVHEAGRRWTLVQEDALDHGISVDPEYFGRVSDQERDYARLWKGFVDAIAIRERINPKLQMGHLPLRYRPNMTEWQEDLYGAESAFGKDIGAEPRGVYFAQRGY